MPHLRHSVLVAAASFSAPAAGGGENLDALAALMGARTPRIVDHWMPNHDDAALYPNRPAQAYWVDRIVALQQS